MELLKQRSYHFFADRYGQAIIGAPPKSGYNLIAWVLPVVALAGALVASIFVLRSMTSKPVVSATSPESEIDSHLQPFLEMVDSDLGLGREKQKREFTGRSYRRWLVWAPSVFV
ncbi:MAG: hypothetical protein CM1200mP35_04660 [Chloroflexota bacterium]|nr:MAG: hypothetical protein CM1200mP35_04660 [Chloroflexota bacterium]